MILNDLLKTLAGKGGEVLNLLAQQGNAGQGVFARKQNAPAMDFSFLNRAPSLDPNLSAILTSQNVKRNRRDMAGNDIPAGSQNYWSGPSGLDAYKAMQPKGSPGATGASSLGTPLSSTDKTLNEIGKLRAANPNEDLTSLLRRKLGKK